MKSSFFTLVFIITFICFSCKKEYSCENCSTVNEPPLACAGHDQTITLPVDSVILNGSCSKDPNNNISGYAWSKISGPLSFSIANNNSVQTLVKNLAEGIYQFELKVTDDGGLYSTDTITITVKSAGIVNQPPVAKAGIDQTIIFPVSVVTLNGNSSYDPDGTIMGYLWNQIMGPNQSVISNSSQVSSTVNNLISGVYLFELKVTDNGGLSAKDTIQINIVIANECGVNRPVIDAQLVQIGTLSLARQDIYTATAGNKILFAGGLGSANVVSSRVDIYDFVSNAWSTAELSIPRHAMTVAVIGNKIFFAGGISDFTGFQKYSRVDIYDAVANNWSTAELSQARGYLTSATVADRVFFAGGWWWENAHVFSDQVDIYNNTTNTWSTATLSQAREGLSATTGGNKIYFAGGRGYNGIASTIDIYDANTSSWSISNLIEGKQYSGSIAVANKIYWSGGYKSLLPPYITCQVEIKDINTQISTIAALSQPTASSGTVVKGNEIIFFMGMPSNNTNQFDIYNIATNVWSIGSLNEGLEFPAIISKNNKIYVAGGKIDPGGGLSNKVSLLEW